MQTVHLFCDDVMREWERLIAPHLAGRCIIFGYQGAFRKALQGLSHANAIFWTLIDTLMGRALFAWFLAADEIGRGSSTAYIKTSTMVKPPRGQVTPSIRSAANSAHRHRISESLPS